MLDAHAMTFRQDLKLKVPLPDGKRFRCQDTQGHGFKVGSGNGQRQVSGRLMNNMKGSQLNIHTLDYTGSRLNAEIHQPTEFRANA